MVANGLEEYLQRDCPKKKNKDRRNANKIGLAQCRRKTRGPGLLTEEFLKNIMHEKDHHL